ncbi:MAG: tRNA (uridine(34)/cytosine(34)/5-carboxymethylaminomethyluridine(34)-2'-O)-methyltransferase TrmL [Ruminococcaceae bacterium]|nr:tRNA (uridine(34)/cytosine(34)/5-carboxymethylaminomethyluridine(34)-2'-O)-methyltransferase TrmL [Oscillospiraceae bacterium]
MSRIHIVLVEPEIPQNTGNIARTCAAVGATLHLVKPLGFTVDNAKLKRAGLDYWDKLDIRYHDSLDAFMEQHGEDPLFFFTTKAPRNYAEVTYPDECFLVFGKETAGLPEALLQKHPSRCVRIPMRETLRSLNLSNCAAVAVYEVLRQGDFEGLSGEGHPVSFDW